MADAVTKLFKPEAGTVHWLNECIKRSQGEAFSEVVTISPALAAIVLSKNDHNRTLRKTKLAQLVADMRHGRWAFNGEPIIIAKTGELNDGQHRLHALVEANVTHPFMVVFGVERDTRVTVDQGVNRSAGDYLHMDGVPNAAALAGLIRLVIGYELSAYESIMDAGRVTNAQVLARAENDALATEAAEFALAAYNASRHLAPPSVIGFCYYTFAVDAKPEAKDYMQQVCIGENLKRLDPAYAVRERLISLGQKSREKRTEIIFRGWCAYREKRQLNTVPVLGKLPELA